MTERETVFQATRNDIKKLEANFETIKNLERTIQKEVDRPLSSLHEKTVELKRQIDQLDRRLKDRAEIIEVRRSLPHPPPPPLLSNKANVIES